MFTKVTTYRNTVSAKALCGRYCVVIRFKPAPLLYHPEMDECEFITVSIKIVDLIISYLILEHPKIKLFITQGGLQSTDEAITAGVPLIGIPMLGDQWYNVEKYVHHKIGLRLDMKTLNQQNLEGAIKTVIEDER